MKTANREAERSLDEVVWDAIDGDTNLPDAAKYLVLAALEGDDALSKQIGGAEQLRTRPETAGGPDEEPVGAFLTSISVAGFRGIGPKAVLDLHPAPGITIVSGRNGSGKSSFAEALEFAVTSSSYRWKNKAKLWADSWRNLHSPDPCEVRVGLTVEGSQPTVVGVDWPIGATLHDNEAWTQTGKQKRTVGTDELGWKSAVELHRPILSYDEIGGLVEDSPSTLYDALAKLLGLDEIADAEKRLIAALKAAKIPRQRANEDLRQLKEIVAESADERAQSAVTQLKKRTHDLDEVLALATGSGSAVAPTLSGLRRCATLAVPQKSAIEVVVADLRVAVADTVEHAGDALSVVEQRSDILDRAIQLHSGTGIIECPVCAEGVLDDAWAAQSRTRLAEQNSKLGKYRQSRRDLDNACRAAKELLNELVRLESVDGQELESLTRYRDSVVAAQGAPTGVTELAEHIEKTLPAVIDAANAVREEASLAIAEQEDTWAPIAGRLMTWVNLERDARLSDDTVKVLDAAKKWVAAHAAELRNQRLEPIAEQAREIWSELRQESNVDIGSISLEGSNTRRRAVLKGSVDGVPTEALAVMSQGELHALALALFIPRATTPNSPFRFIVLDDPIQAMDPAKIDGFIRVLSKLSETRQVIVFSHDDRLATAIRQLAVNARLVEVARETGSQVCVAEALNQATRYVDDVRALVLDENVPDEVKRRVAPGLFRLALESAAQQVYYAKQHKAGESRVDTENRWTSVKKTRAKIALAVYGDAEKPLSQWQILREGRKATLNIANAGSHVGADMSITRSEVNDLRKTVDGILAE